MKFSNFVTLSDRLVRLVRFSVLVQNHWTGCQRSKIQVKLVPSSQENPKLEDCFVVLNKLVVSQQDSMGQQHEMDFFLFRTFPNACRVWQLSLLGRCYPQVG